MAMHMPILLRNGLRLAAFVVLSASLAACSKDTRRSLGLERTPPDAMQVVTRAPLELPPDFGLRPPQPGVERPNEASPREQARATIFGGTAKTPLQDFGDRSPGEAQLLKAAGADTADPAIRDKVNRESSQLAMEDSTFVDELVFWKDKPVPGEPIDAEAEAKRLRENAALGKPPGDGPVPVIKRKASSGSFFGNLF